MNRDDIIRMVKKAGGGQLSDRQFQLHGLDTSTNFAKLIAEYERNEIIQILEDSTGYVQMDLIRDRGQA